MKLIYFFHLGYAMISMQETFERANEFYSIARNVLFNKMDKIDHSYKELKKNIKDNINSVVSNILSKINEQQIIQKKTPAMESVKDKLENDYQREKEELHKKKKDNEETVL